MKKIATLLFGCIPISFFKIFLLNLIGHNISYKSKIGVNFFLVDHIFLEKGAIIKHFNFIKIHKLVLKEKAYIKYLNYIKGPLTVELSEESGISNQNKIRRAYPPITYSKALLFLGKHSFIVSKNFLDLTRSITIGDNSILAGIGSQLWTHGYYHADVGKKRIRIDGDITVGNNVYIGSRTIFNPGVSIGNSIHIGSGSIISKDLTEKGMYVNQPLRFIENSIENVIERLDLVDNKESTEIVYLKKNKI